VLSALLGSQAVFEPATLRLTGGKRSVSRLCGDLLHWPEPASSLAESANFRHFLRHRESFALGPFTITPFLNDHSAFDTYSLLIEADGRRLFYSADLQAHGRRAGIVEEFVRKGEPHEASPPQPACHR
jgi:hypothetical protein